MLYHKFFCFSITPGISTISKIPKNKYTRSCLSHHAVDFLEFLESMEFLKFHTHAIVIDHVPSSPDAGEKDVNPTKTSGTGQ